MSESSNFQRARLYARRALRKGDAVEAKRWLAIADTELRVRERLNRALDDMMQRDEQIEQENEAIRLREAKASRPSTTPTRITAEKLNRITDELERKYPVPPN